MRVHRNKNLVRRESILLKDKYREYYDELFIDFKGVCGYCGKDSELFLQRFQVDHFVPMKFDSTLELQYTNLVLACPKCNRGKWYHWPTQNKNLHHNGNEGFVDPTSDEFDLHLQRNPKGDIIPLTPVGTYMHSKFKFNIRPISIIWKAMELDEKIKKIESKINSIEDFEKLRRIIKIKTELEDMKLKLFRGREIS